MSASRVQRRTRAPVALDEYIAARVVECGDCLRWTGSLVAGRHPTMRLAGGKQALIRRLVVEAARGTIPRGRIVRCTCETPTCIALEHLVVTTYGHVARECGANGLMSGPVRSARIAAAKRSGKQAKIRQEDARAIRASDASLSTLARRYGINQATVSKIRRGVMRREFGAGNPWQGLVP